MVINLQEIESLKDLLLKIKEDLHKINRYLFQKKKAPLSTSVLVNYLEYIWIAVHTFREEEELLLEKFDGIQLSIDKIAGQSSVMRKNLKKEFDFKLFGEDFIILRRFVEQLEKGIVKLWYLKDTGKVASKVGGIPLAARVARKSEVTIRRYIFAERIYAYKISKKWWIPYEEADSIRKGG